MTTILGIETSCDETAAAVVVDGCDVRSNVVAVQNDLHAKYGGVVPEIASRAHIERLDDTVAEALAAAGVGYVLSPVDLVPSLLFGPTGLIDDAIVVSAALSRILNHVHPDIVDSPLPSDEISTKPGQLQTRDSLACSTGMLGARAGVAGDVRNLRSPTG